MRIQNRFEKLEQVARDRQLYAPVVEVDVGYERPLIIPETAIPRLLKVYGRQGDEH